MQNLCCAPCLYNCVCVCVRGGVAVTAQTHMGGVHKSHILLKTILIVLRSKHNEYVHIQYSEKTERKEKTKQKKIDSNN